MLPGEFLLTLRQFFGGERQRRRSSKCRTETARGTASDKFCLAYFSKEKKGVFFQKKIYQLAGEKVWMFGLPPPLGGGDVGVVLFA